MNAGKAVYGILSANSGVTDIVGTNIFPEIAEQETAVPFIVYQLQSVDPDDTHDGPSKLDEVRFEFLCYADSYNAAADLGVAVRAALDRVSGTYNGVHVESIQFNDVDVNIEYDPRRYSQVLTFTFRIKRDDVTIALGTPVTGAVLGDLSDVDVTGVTNGQLIAYNSTSGNWEAANDAGGAETLDDLTDVDAGAPSSGQLLAYGQDTWETIAQDELTLPIGSVTGLQAALDAAPDNLRELTDVTISGLADNDYLQYDSASGTWQNSSLILGRNGEQYTGNYDSEAETLLDGATETVELYYTAQADGDGLHEDAQSDTATTGYDIRRKLYYAEKAQADPNTSGDWTQFADIADDTTYASAKATLLAYLKARTGGTVPISLKMTWEEVAEAPSFTGLLNETYGSGAAAAYSVRRLNGLYTGAAIQVERTSDNQTQDIGFDANGDLDESALTTFCTGTTCRVRTWYDQATAGGTGSGNDAVQTTHANQPTIYTGGAIVKENGRPALEMQRSTQRSLSATGFAIVDATGDFAAFAVYEESSTDSSNSGIYFGPTSHGMRTSSNLYGSYYYDSGSYSGGINSGTTLTDVIQLVSSHADGTNYKIFTNGANEISSTLLGTPDNPTDGVVLGNTSGLNRGLEGHLLEVILYDADKSTDRTQIESNIGDYFTQNTPLLDTYTGAAAAYSLRKLRSAYSGSAIRVRRASDNAESDIGFNVFGELSTVELAAFCGSSDGFVKTWYCQSGNANDATQTNTANQPKIYDGTTGVVTENGKPAVIGVSTDSQLSLSSSISFTDFCLIHVYEEITNNKMSWCGNSSQQYYYHTGTNHRINGMINFAHGLTTNAQTLDFANRNAGAVEVHLNGSSVGTATYATSYSFQHLFNRSSGGFGYEAPIQEFILYTSDQSANRTNIEDNINTFYSIY